MSSEKKNDDWLEVRILTCNKNADHAEPVETVSFIYRRVEKDIIHCKACGASYIWEWQKNLLMTPTGKVLPADLYRLGEGYDD